MGHTNLVQTVDSELTSRDTGRLSLLASHYHTIGHTVACFAWSICIKVMDSNWSACIYFAGS